MDRTTFRLHNVHNHPTKMSNLTYLEQPTRFWCKSYESLKFEWLPYFLPCKSNSRKIFSEQAIQVLMSFRLIYWIKVTLSWHLQLFMSQFFATYSLLLIQSIGIFVLCSTGVILPIIFKPACTVQSAKPKLFTHLLPEVLYHHLFDSTS